MTAPAMRLVPLAPEKLQPRLPDLAALRRAVGAVEGRWHAAQHRRSRYATRRMARVALLEVANVVAGVSLHLPVHGPVQQAIDGVLRELSAAAGRCPGCGKRIASWSPCTGRPDFHHGPDCARAGGAS